MAEGFDWENLASRLMQTWPARLAQSAIDAAKLPGDVYAGRIDPSDPNYYNRAAELAQFLVGTPGGSGGLGSGIRRATFGEAEPLSFTERMELGKQLALERANRGFSTGPSGRVKLMKTAAPDPRKGTFDRLAAETRAAFQGDKDRILEQYRRATGTSDADKVLLAPGESLEDLAAGLGF